MKRIMSGSSPCLARKLSPSDLRSAFVGLAMAALTACGGAASAGSPAVDRAAVVDVGPAPSVSASAPDAATLAKDMAEQAGVLGALKGAEFSAIGDGTMMGVPPDGATNTIWGDASDDGFSGGGLGLRGTGLGAGGTGSDTIGIGTIGTLGHGAGTGGGSGYGLGGGPKAHAGAKIGTGTPPVVTGSLPPEVIRRIVRQSISQVRFCYEKELVKNPALAGKISMSFVIGKTGAVTSASVGSSDVASTEVGKCLTTVFQKMTFPAPDGGGIVKVSYPFVFSPGDVAANSGSPAASATAKPAGLHGAALLDATSTDLEAALTDEGWKIVSRARRNAGAGSIVDLVAEKNGVRANITFQPAKHADAAIGVDEVSRVATAGAYRTSGDFFLGIVVAGQRPAAEALLQLLVGG